MAFIIEEKKITATNMFIVSELPRFAEGVENHSLILTDSILCELKPPIPFKFKVEIVFSLIKFLLKYEKT